MSVHETGPFGPWIPDWLKRQKKQPDKREQPQIPLPEDEPIPEYDPDKQPTPPVEKPGKVIIINPDGTTEEK